MNEFINFNQRGFLLPDGCKDLIDVLKPQKKAPVPAEGLESLPAYLARLLDSPAQIRHLAIRSTNPFVTIWLIFSGNSLKLGLSVNPAQEMAARQVFTAAKIPVVDAKLFPTCTTASYFLCPSFPTERIQAAQILSDLLVKGCGLATDAKLDFTYLEKPAPAK